MRQLNLQLYGRTAQTDFSEKLSAWQTATLTPQPSLIELQLKAPGREKFVELRLDPDNKPSSFVLHELTIHDGDGAEIYRWNGDPDSLDNLIDLRTSVVRDDVIVESESDDPFMLIALPKPQGGTISLRLTVSQVLSGSHQQELADAVRSLQSILRVAIDDLAAEQEGLQDALVVHHAHARSETDGLKDQLSQIAASQIPQLSSMLEKLTSNLNSIEAEVAETARKMRNSVLAEVRDDWRLLNRKIELSAEQISKDSLKRDAALAAARDAEIAQLLETMSRFADSSDSMKKVRTELGASHDEDAIAKLRQLKAEAQNARGGLLSWFSRASS